MKYLSHLNSKLIIVVLLILITSCNWKPTSEQKIHFADIDNFWNAYDKITSTKDSVLQYQYLKYHFIEKGSEGLENIMKARNYKPKDYIHAINTYPKFWVSIRENTLNTSSSIDDIKKSIQQLKDIYPDLETVPIYFTVGAFRTGGTIWDKTVLIGCELSCGDKSTVIDELPEWRQKFYKEYNPIQDLDLLCTHEYIHTQQNELTDNLLAYCIYEGVAEFVSTQAIGKPSNTPAVKFGKENEALVKAKFEQDMFIPEHTYNWLWGENKNELKVRDLGYYIGYSICENYFNIAIDKSKAIKEMIELDFNDEKQIETFVDDSKFLNNTLDQLRVNFKKSYPRVIRLEPMINESTEVNPDIKQITLKFSVPMNKESRGFDYGPLGEKKVLKVQNVIGYSEDGMSFTFDVSLAPNKQYQSLVSNRFYSASGIPLEQYLIDFKTKTKTN